MNSTVVEGAISKAIKQGQTEVVIYQELDISVIKYLEGCGYYVELMVNELSGLWTYIAWANK